MKNQIVFTMGLPGAGKTTTARAMFPGAAVIDPDAVKESHPDYDPKNPAALHAWSKDVAETQFAAAIEAGAGHFIVDGTATNICSVIEKMRRARRAGFRVVLLFVSVPLAVALQRNAARARNVPARIIHEKAAMIEKAFNAVSLYADNVLTIDNAAHRAAVA